MASYQNLVGSILIFEGNIAVGKSTLVKSICRFLSLEGYPPIFFAENISKPLLDLYLSDKRKYAFPFQVIVARDRKNILSKAARLASNGRIVIIDRGLLGDKAFATMQKDEGFFTSAEFKVYLDLVEAEPIHVPIHHVFLDCTPEVAFSRMLERNIPEEVESYNLDYFVKVDKAHRNLLDGWVKKIDWNPPVQRDGGMLSDEICQNVLQAIILDGTQLY
jgi:deoxyadenosine/deoxycytidine kinase